MHFGWGGLLEAERTRQLFSAVDESSDGCAPVFLNMGPAKPTHRYEGMRCLYKRAQCHDDVRFLFLYRREEVVEWRVATVAKRTEGGLLRTRKSQGAHAVRTHDLSLPKVVHGRERARDDHDVNLGALYARIGEIKLQELRRRRPLFRKWRALRENCRCDSHAGFLEHKHRIEEKGAEGAPLCCRTE
jgi:hypothetical protein